MSFQMLTSTMQDGNMSIVHGSPSVVLKNRSLFLARYGIDTTHCIMMDSEHGDVIKVIAEALSPHQGTKNSIKSDALLTTNRKLALALPTADCLPVGLYDKTSGIFGLIHMSRHTFCLDLLEKTLKKFNQLNGNVNSLVISVGPHIHKCSYSFSAPLQHIHPKLKPYIEEIRGRVHIDLPRATSETLISLGVRAGNITISSIDTFSHQSYFSHLESATQNLPEGRIISVVAWQAYL